MISRIVPRWILSGAAEDAVPGMVVVLVLAADYADSR